MRGVVTKGSESLKQEEKEQRILAEIERLHTLFEGIEDNKLKAAKPLIENAAFMAITLADLQEIINIKGCVEEYQNGANQRGFKKTSEVEVYNVMIKNYVSVTKQLADFVPTNPATGNELIDFVRGVAKWPT